VNVPFVVATFIGLLLPIFAPRNDIVRARRTFWAGVGVAVVSAFFIAFPPDWKSGAQLSAFVAFMMLGTAYFTSPYLKFRGTIHAAYRADAQAEDSLDRSRPGATVGCSRKRGSSGGSRLRMTIYVLTMAPPVMTGGTGSWATGDRRDRA